MLTQIFHLHACSALHVGTGQAVGVVDLPIARARATHLPIVPGSGIKGVLRDEFADHAGQKTLFGPESIGTGDSAHAGALVFGDAHLLLLPVRSLAGICAFATCPFVLARYAEDLQRAGNEALPVPEVAAGEILVGSDSLLKASDDLVVLEDLDLRAAAEADAWANAIAGRIHAADANWQAHLKRHFAILSDDDFSFLADTATEIRARIRIGERGVVQNGALWYEENLPAETVLWGSVAAGPARDGREMAEAATLAAFAAGIGKERLIQIGGKATVGRGLVRFIV